MPLPSFHANGGKSVRIVIKPLGAALVLCTIAGLAYIAVRSSSSNSTQYEIVSGAAGTTAPAPAATSAPGATSALAPSTTKGPAIYTDSLQNGWGQYGWAKVIQYANASPAYPEGPKARSIRAVLGGFEGVKIHHPSFNTTPYDRMTLRLHGGPKGGQTVEVAAYLTTKAGAAQTEGGTIICGPIPPGKWVSVVVPLKRLNVDRKPDLTDIWVKNQSGEPTTIFLDDIRMLRPQDPAPTGEILAERGAP